MIFNLIKKTRQNKFLLTAIIVCIVLVVSFGYFKIARADGEFSEFIGMVLGAIFNVFIEIFSFFLGLAGKILDWTMSEGAMKLISNGIIVDIGWVVMRDLVNMTFILILLLYAFSKVLGLSNTFSNDKLVTRLVIAALLINFSKVICFLLIDISNVITMFFLGGLNGTVGENISNALSLQKLFESGIGAGLVPASTATKVSSILLTQVFICVMMGITTFVFAMVAIMFLERIFALWIIVMFSPAAWFYYTVYGNWGSWWKHFWKYLVMAPTATFFFYLIIRILNVQGGLASLISEANFTTNDSMWSFFGNSLKLMIPYAFCTGLMLFAYKQSKQAGTKFGEKMQGYVQKGSDKVYGGLKAGGLALGGSALLGAKTLGAGLVGFRDGGGVEKGRKIIQEWKEGKQKLIEKTPLLGRAVGGPGVFEEKREKAQKDAIGKFSEEFKNRSKDALGDIVSQKVLSQQDRYRRAAALQLLAEKGNLKDEHFNYAKGLAIDGLNTKVIVDSRPDWATEFYKPKPGKARGTDQDIYNETFAELSPKKFAESSMKFENISDEKNIPDENNPEIKISKRDMIKRAIQKNFETGRISSSHLESLSRGENMDLAEDIKGILNNPDIDVSKLNPALQKYLSGPAGQSLWGKNVKEKIEKQEQEKQKQEKEAKDIQEEADKAFEEKTEEKTIFLNEAEAKRADARKKQAKTEKN